MIDLIVKCFNLEFPSATCKLVALAVARRCGGDLGECFASQATLAEDTQVHAKTVGRCLAELEALGWISRTKGRASNTGTRKTDRIFLTLPEVVLPASPRKGVLDKLSDQGSPGLPAKVTEDSLDGSGGLPKETKKKPSEEESTAGSGSGDGEEDEGEEPGVHLGVATDMIWQTVGKVGRERSSRADVRRALEAALKRRPAGEPAEHRLRRIMVGIRGYLQSDEATRDRGAYERGAHRTIEKDRWEVFEQEAQAAEDRAAQAPAATGTKLAPGPDLQALWMQLHAQDGRWPDDWGPRPGMAGCRVSEALQRQHGYEPVVPSDDAAFD